MACEFRTKRRVEFAETDSAGIAHFSVFFRYMEEAEHAFLRSLKLSVSQRTDDGRVIGFPRVSARCQYARAVRFEDVIDIHLWVSGKKKKTLEYSCILSHSGKEVARGQWVVIASQVGERHSMVSVPLPEKFEEALEEATYRPIEFYPKNGGGPQ